MSHIQTYTSTVGMANDEVPTSTTLSALNFILADEGSRQNKPRL
jgi:hypothetical protein